MTTYNKDSEPFVLWVVRKLTVQRLASHWHVIGERHYDVFTDAPPLVDQCVFLNNLPRTIAESSCICDVVRD